MSSETKPMGTDYSISQSDAKEIIGTSLLPSEYRRMVLRKYIAENGPDALVNLFAEFIGMANSIVANTREFVEMYLIVECNHDPHTAEKINLPTVTGALQGIRVAGDAKGMCGGCAYRIGSAANQSPLTTLDAHDCADDGTKFFCHERLNKQGEPFKLCAGFVAAMPEWQKEIVLGKPARRSGLPQ